jgi:cell division protein FtsB
MRRKKLLLRAAVGLVILLLLYVFILGDYSVFEVGSLYVEKEKLREKVAQMEKEEKDLIATEKAVRSDSLELERLAREKIGMVKPGEKLFKAIVVDDAGGVTDQLETLKLGEDEKESGLPRARE